MTDKKSDRSDRFTWKTGDVIIHKAPKKPAKPAK